MTVYGLTDALQKRQKRQKQVPHGSKGRLLQTQKCIFILLFPEKAKVKIKLVAVSILSTQMVVWKHFLTHKNQDFLEDGWL